MLRGLLLVLLIGSATLSLAEPDADRTTFNYAGGKLTDVRRCLDVYEPSSQASSPIMIWIHGGGWRIGDKSHEVEPKVHAFNSAGIVFVAVNYRFVPHVTVAEQAGDVAQAIAWVHDHADQIHGDAEKIYLMGHSAGAHLAALVATDESYLHQFGRSLADIKGVVLLDGAAYDVSRQIQQVARPGVKSMFQVVFTEDPDTQMTLSPITHVTPGKKIPPFLILYVADRRDSKIQSDLLGKALNDAGSESRVVPAPNKTHATINSEVGVEGDGPTREIFSSLDQWNRP